MKKSLVRLADAFMQSRHLQAQRIIRDHAHLLMQHEVRVAAKNMDKSCTARTEPVRSIAPAEFKLVA